MQPLHLEERRGRTGFRPAFIRLMRRRACCLGQRDGVGMGQTTRQHGDRSAFNSLAILHDDDVISHPGNDPQIMGDQHHRHAILTGKALDQPEDFKLGCGIERGCRLISD